MQQIGPPIYLLGLRKHIFCDELILVIAMESEDLRVTILINIVLQYTRGHW